MKLNEIYQGWKNVLLTDEEVERIAKGRLEICNTCPSKMSMMGVDVCGACHCPLIAKTRSIESLCPLERWERKEI